MTSPFKRLQYSQSVFLQTNNVQSSGNCFSTSEFRRFSVVHWIGCNQEGKQTMDSVFQLPKRNFIDSSPRAIDCRGSILFNYILFEKSASELLNLRLILLLFQRGREQDHGKGHLHGWLLFVRNSFSLNLNNLNAPVFFLYISLHHIARNPTYRFLRLF